ncbi:MAG: hypothetical protein ACO3FI_09050 [Cyclobacteriaceae bacterium]
MEFNEIYQEEIYHISQNIGLVLNEPWEKLSVPSQTMLINLTNALKQKPAPQILYLTESELNSLEKMPDYLVLFGHNPDGIKVHLPTTFRSRSVTLTYKPEHLAQDPEAKKELWAAIRLMLSRNA